MKLYHESGLDAVVPDALIINGEKHYLYGDAASMILPWLQAAFCGFLKPEQEACNETEGAWCGGGVGLQRRQKGLLDALFPATTESARSAARPTLSHGGAVVERALLCLRRSHGHILQVPTAYLEGLPQDCSRRRGRRGARWCGCRRRCCPRLTASPPHLDAPNKHNGGASQTEHEQHSWAPGTRFPARARRIAERYGRRAVYRHDFFSPAWWCVPVRAH